MEKTKLREGFAFNFIATGVGSVPFLNVDDTCKSILENFPEMPFWPQFVRKSTLEDMSVQVFERLPLLALNDKKNSVLIKFTASKEKELTSFYEHFLEEDTDYFAVSSEYAAGLYKLLQLMEETGENYGPFIKGQIIGPITFAGNLRGSDGKTALGDFEIMDTIVKGLSIKTLWLAEKMSVSGKEPVIFLDEPYLSGFGSAFTPIQRHEVIAAIGELVEYVKSRCNVLIGLHCCGNTDWAMIMEAGVDIVNFDAFEYMEYFLLYRKELVEFIQNGGTIAWGIIPTLSFSGKETLDELKILLEKGLNKLCEWGINKDIVAARSIITPACGLGAVEPAKAQAIFELLHNLSDLMANSIE